jgi:transcription elongation GreA/GreB family factor
MDQPNKSNVILAVKNRILSMLNTVTESLESERNAIQQETKSSAGDKYETQREMLQADIRRSEHQLNESTHHLDIIDHLFDFHGNIIVGTLIELKLDKQNMWIFIGPAIGDVIVDQIKVKTVSQASPFGHLLMGKTIGDAIVFNQKSFSIVNCY